MTRVGGIVAIVVAILFFVMLTFRGDGVVAPEGQVVNRETSLTVPVAGVRRNQLADDWHDAREGGVRVHEALDIPAPAGTPVVAAMAGTVEKLFASEAGGITVYVRSTDSKWMAYYAHLQRYAEGLAEGQRVKQGAPIGFVGDTGNAGVGNNHLHFALARMRPGERWYQGTPVNPYPFLAAKAPSR